MGPGLAVPHYHEGEEWPILLSAEHISKNYGMKTLLEDVSIYLSAGDEPTNDLDIETLTILEEKIAAQ